jgi:phosphate transport system permease protein
MTAVADRSGVDTESPGVAADPIVPGAPAPRRPRARRTTSSRTPDDIRSLIGSIAGSLGTTWVLYERVLPFSGKVGFVVCWYLVFVAFYAAVTAVLAPRNLVVDRIMTTMVIGAPLLVFAALVSMIVFTVIKGSKALFHVNFFTSDQAGVAPLDPLSHGGILHAIVGTLIEMGIAVAIALPLGLITAVYLSEVGGRGARLVRTVIEAMTALPSIVAGLFVYSFVIADLHFQPSGFAAALALSVMGLPIMARASDVVLRVVPGGLREASYALGAGRWQTVWRVVLPTARPGLATALILGIARMVGETSPLLLTSGPSSFMNYNPFHNQMNSLPLYIFTSVTSGQSNSVARGFAAAVVLLALVLFLFLLARFVAREPRRRS